MDDFEQPPKLRTVDDVIGAPAAPQQPLRGPNDVNALAELVADLIAATGLISPDKLALVRGRAGQGSLAEAIVAEGVASGEGIARTYAWVRERVAG